MLGLTDTYERYCIDDVVMEWGLYVRSELHKIGPKQDKKAKTYEGQRTTRLRQLLSGDTVQKFATPVATR